MTLTIAVHLHRLIDHRPNPLRTGRLEEENLEACETTGCIFVISTSNGNYVYIFLGERWKCTNDLQPALDITYVAIIVTEERFLETVDVILCWKEAPREISLHLRV